MWSWEPGQRTMVKSSIPDLQVTIGDAPGSGSSGDSVRLSLMNPGLVVLEATLGGLNARKSTGRTIKVRIVAETNPPMITIANGF